MRVLISSLRLYLLKRNCWQAKCFDNKLIDHYNHKEFCCGNYILRITILVVSQSEKVMRLYMLQGIKMKHPEEKSMALEQFFFLLLWKHRVFNSKLLFPTILPCHEHPMASQIHHISPLPSLLFVAYICLIFHLLKPVSQATIGILPLTESQSDR